MIPPDGAFYIYMDISQALAKGKNPMTAMQFSEYLLETQHVAMVSGGGVWHTGLSALELMPSQQRICWKHSPPGISTQGYNLIPLIRRDKRF